MGAIDDFMKRRGWVKLDRYGLVLTPDDRVLSTRPAVLDDGLGGKIVGWAEGDLAAMELEKWAPAGMPAAAKTVAVTRSPQPIAAPVRPSARGLPGVAPAPEMPAPPVNASIAFAPTEMARPAAPPPAPVRATAPMATVAAPAPKFVAPAHAPAPEVAEAAGEGEDEWEWEIAMARARAASEEIGTAAAAMGFTKPKAPAPQPKKTLQMPPVSAAASPAPKAPLAPQAPQGPRTMPMAAVAMGKPEPMPAWPKTEELPAQWSEETAATATRVMSPLEKQLAVGKRSTVIPVPELPVAARPSDVRPVPSTRTSVPRMRIARGTGREDTVLTQPAPPSKEDSTSPYVTLPAEVKPTGYAHTKRAAAKHR